MFIESDTGFWEYVIGLEIHAQINSKSKLFSSSRSVFGSTPNTNVAFFDAAIPGALPILNEDCVRQAIKTSIALNCKINKYSVFDRKNYFYPDLPSGYQISQFYIPLAFDGYLEVETESGLKKIKIARIHLEQDAGKSIHDQLLDYSLIDLNRAGVGLMEIVSDPDIKSPYEAANYIKTLRNILRYLETCDGDMEKGSLRCDANVSVRRKGDTSLGTRCEIKNLNSTKNIIKAIECEALRQIDLLEHGNQIIQETRLFDTILEQTRSMRSKENSSDYRYFPDPDLMPLVIEQSYIDDIKSKMQELPSQKSKRYMQEFSLSKYDADVLTSEKEYSNYFENVAKDVNPKVAANWITGELFGHLNKYHCSINDSKMTASRLVKLIKMIENKVISGAIAKDVLKDIFESGEDPEKIVNDKGLMQISNEDDVLKIIDEVLIENHESVLAYKSGKDKLFGFLVGQVMKKSLNKANPSLVNELLKQKLNA